MGGYITKSTIISSLIWRTIENIGVQGIQFIVMIILARLIEPEDFGIITILLIFVILANVVIQGGFNTALIQKKKIDELDLSSIFYLNMFIASLLYILLYYTAPSISAYFEIPSATLILRILSITLFLNAFNAIQNAIISRNMEFRKSFLSSIIAVLCSGVIGTIIAYLDFGVWALVWQQLSYQILFTVMLFIFIKWKPKLLFSITRVKRLFSFGWKILIASLIDVVEKNIRSLLIGKLFNTALLGFYSRGEQIPSLLVTNINGAIQSVLFPTLSSYQDDKKRVKELVRRAIVTSSFVIFPMMVGLAIIAEPLVALLLTEKWLPAVPFIQIFCAGYALWPIHTANLQAINALGRSDIFLKLEIIKKLLGVVILVASIPFGVYAVAISLVVGGVIASLINAFPNSKLLNYSIREQWNDVIPSLLLSIVMGAVIYPFHWLEIPALLTIVVQVFVGIVIYIGLAALFRLECFSYLLVTLKELLRNRRKMQLKVD